jgi:anti-anti-sigma regulatory factor
MGFEVFSDAGGTIIRVAGTFDGDTAARLRGLLARVVADHHVKSIVVDLGMAREVTPLALAALVDDSEALRAKVRFRGLTRHAARILSHLAPERKRVGGESE